LKEAERGESLAVRDLPVETTDRLISTPFHRAVSVSLAVRAPPSKGDPNMNRALSLMALLLILSVSAFAQTVTPAPELLNFQGRLAKPDGSPVADGTYSIRFSLWSAVSGEPKNGSR